MGFSLHFFNLGDGDIVDADRAGIEEFLTARDLHVEGEAGNSAIVDSSGQRLAFDGFWSDLHIDPLDQEDAVSGGIDHATLTASECAFIYGLCSAGRMMIVNPQGDPLYIVVGRTHSEDDVPEPDDTVWVESPEELANALGSGLGEFREFLQRVQATQDDLEAPRPVEP